MAVHNLTCIVCPMGCRMTAETAASDRLGLAGLKGNACKRGEVYAKDELYNPRRMLTTTVSVRGGTAKLVPVKTAESIPKALLTSCMEVLRRTEASAPVRAGDILAEDILGTGVSVIACADVDMYQGKEREV